MDVLNALGQTIAKMFVADLWLSLGAVGVVAACGLGAAVRFLPIHTVPFVMLAGTLAALGVGILRGASKR